jgi:cobalt-zinc-cadmium efflux system membrane fusion protein
MNIRQILVISSLIIVSNYSFLGLASATDSATTPVQGPHRGTLVQQDKFALEITIFEQGIPPEMRVYAYLDGKTVPADEVDLKVVLSRLDGEQNNLRFTADGDYLFSNQAVAEPHSFEVSIEASHRGRSFRWQYENFEGRTQISDRLLSLAQVETEAAQGQLLTFTDTLFGVISAPQDQVYHVNAPYPALVEQVHVRAGDKVTPGQLLLTLRNTSTLQAYTVPSPAAGEVTALTTNVGDRTENNTLLEITDLSTVWVEMSAFPENIEKLVPGLPVTVYDLHHHERAQGIINYVAPQMTGGHIARARASIDNADGHWRPGMHIKADVQVAQRQVDLAVRSTALQSFRDMPVVFARYGNTFEVRMVELGETDGEFVEVLAGLKPGTEYVTGNSFLIKADILKDGASHDH